MHLKSNEHEKPWMKMDFFLFRVMNLSHFLYLKGNDRHLFGAMILNELIKTTHIQLQSNHATGLLATVELVNTTELNISQEFAQLQLCHLLQFWFVQRKKDSSSLSLAVELMHPYDAHCVAYCKSSF